ncbi:MAG: ABC transporter ATP-binding protein [Bryobacteraceae bacterium]
MAEEAVAKKAIDRKLIGRLLAYAKPYWRNVAAALAFMMVASGLQVAGPLLTKLAIDRYLAPNPNRDLTALDALLEPHLSTDPWTGLTQISVLFLAAMVIGMVCSFCQTYLMMKTGQNAMFDLRRDLMAHLHKLDLAYYDRQPVGRIVTRVTTDVDALNEMLSSAMVAIVGDAFVIAFLIATMLRLSPGMTAMLLAVMPFVLLATRAFRNAAQESNRRIRVAVAKINAFIQENVTGMAVVQLFNRERTAAAQFDTGNREHLEAYRDAIHAYGWFYPVVEFLGILGISALLTYGGWRIERGELTLGVLVAFFQYGMRFFRPIQDLSEKYGALQQAMAAGERVFQLLDTPVNVTAPSAPAALPEGTAPIEFDGVWFAYKDEDWVLRDVSFRVEPGQTVAVVGHTGAGKTTIVSLLLRFYDVQRGAIKIGGIDIRQFSPVELRRRFAIVLQDSFLFTGDLLENIRLGTASISEQQAVDAARDVNLGPFLATAEKGIHYEVRERGAGLSTGQKQLISFARALAHDPRYLILDEATSSVDSETESLIQEALVRLLEGRTSIVIAHRLSTIQRADCILVMHKGELRESGPHQELLAQRGIYWKLFQLQYKDQSLPPAPIGSLHVPTPSNGAERGHRDNR